MPFRYSGKWPVNRSAGFMADIMLNNVLATSSGGVETTANNVLGKDAFLKILIEELRQQNPFRPVDTKDFVAQLAQLRQLEVLEEVRDILTQFLAKGRSV
ncbi:Flagellar hook capping protein-N-terminal region [Thermanaeromonas toyohensis ToBE]|uniref:Flagellar hook capping protein-N-terminal region n=1 Tax=Thermanaeromonas toyohensis ToBE TaxID=698762 RepID=A0A1W1VU00_9FIRM|nr:Flagellar hook capping protein-N-terminal region [Thermanaeromonas toyohensis ToBE]